MFYNQVGKTKRLLQVSSSIFWCLFAAGPLFGFAALKPFLIREHVYEDVCLSEQSLGDLYQLFSEGESGVKCTEQDLKLNLIFTISAVLTNVSALPIGYLLDNYGPRACGLVGASFILLGSVVVINPKVFLGHFDPFLVGYGLVSLGGPFTFISSFHLSNAFPDNSGTVLALLTGAFDASSSVFVIYSMLNKLLSTSEYYFSIADFFKIYLAIPLFILTVQLFLMPSESYQSPPTLEPPHLVTAEEVLQAEINEHTSLIKSRRRSSVSNIARVSVSSDTPQQVTASSGGVYGVLHGKSAGQQFKTYWFALLALFSMIQMLRLNYFISTINSQYTFLFGSNKMATKLNKIFDLALPLGGLVSIPFVGYYLDHFSTVTVVATLSAVSVGLGVLGFVPHSFLAGLVNVLLFVVYRPFFYTTISDVCGKVFGFETFGIIYGTIMSIAGVVNYGQAYCDTLTHTVFHMNPGPINYILVATTFIIALFTTGYIKNQAHQRSKDTSNALE